MGKWEITSDFNGEHRTPLQSLYPTPLAPAARRGKDFCLGSHPRTEQIPLINRALIINRSTSGTTLPKTTRGVRLGSEQRQDLRETQTEITHGGPTCRQNAYQEISPREEIHRDVMLLFGADTVRGSPSHLASSPQGFLLSAGTIWCSQRLVCSAGMRSAGLSDHLSPFKG